MFRLVSKVKSPRIGTQNADQIKIADFNGDRRLDFVVTYIDLASLGDYAALLDKQTDIKTKLKAAQDDLEAKLDAKYPKLTEDEIKQLVVDDKWLATLADAVQGELDRVSQTLTSRIRQLAERYATPLPTLTKNFEALSARVDEQLKKMGAVWN